MADPTPVPAAELAAANDSMLEATRLAWRWHGDQTRKGRATSYMSHLLQVQGFVIGAGGGPNEAIAALLHDALEDAPSVAERAERESLVAARFDAAVLEIVLDLTDTQPGETVDAKAPWRARKERYLDQLSRAGAPSLLVAACDKRQNLGDLVDDLRHEGVATLDRFNAGGPDQVWYFESLAAICRPAIPGRLTRELSDLIAALRDFVEG